MIKKKIHKFKFYKRYHKYIGLSIAVFFMLFSVTGILLGIKKETNLLPKTQKGSNSDLQEWISFSEIERIAIFEIDKKVDNPTIDKIDARPSKGIVKVIFEQGYWEVQINATTGEVLSIERRYSDLIENIHDGSILGNLFKISYNLLGGVFALFLVTSGFLIWMLPRKMKKIKQNLN